MNIIINEKNHMSKFLQQYGGNNGDIKQFACGLNHIFILTNDNKLYSCGENDYSQLGRTGDETLFMEVSIEKNISGTKKIVCGNNYTIVLTNDNKIYSCGDNYYGQLGRIGNNKKMMEVLIEGNRSGIKDISCGHDHTFVLTNDNKLYSCGDNVHGQLGRNGDNKKLMEVLIEGNNSEIRQISCGLKYTFVLTDNKLYSCGSNGDGRLGRNGDREKFMEVLIEGNSSGIKQVACGGAHSLVLTNNNKLYSCGNNDSYQLGRTGETTKLMEVFIEGNNSEIKQIACGNEHTFILTNNNKLYSCGKNDNGQLGRIGDNKKLVEVLIEENHSGIKYITCSVYYTFILTNNKLYFVNQKKIIDVHTQMMTETNCPRFESNGCDFLTKKKDLIYVIDGEIYNEISNITYIMGFYERSDTNSLIAYNTLNYSMPLSIQNYFNTLVSHNFDDKMRKIRTDMFIDQIYDPITNVLTKRIKPDKQEVIETKYDLIKCDVFGSGDLSFSLLVEMKYNSKNAPITQYNSIAKIYPIDFAAIVKNDPEYKKYFKSQTDWKRLDNYVDYLFMREGMIGCWIKNNLILKSVSPAFACIFDTYRMKAIPMSKEIFTTSYNLVARKEYKKKRWITTINDEYDTLHRQIKFGYIEMEKLDMTLFDLMTKGSNYRYFDLGMIFEIFYAKLSLMFFGNVYMLDDHSNNIMVKKVNIIRHYKITRRRTIYNFYINNPYLVKYIDFERFETVKDRNKFINSGSDKFLTQVLKVKPIIHNNFDNEVKKYLETQLSNPLKATVDNFCEIMTRCLPPNYKQYPQKSKKQIITYSIDLDIAESEISDNFIGKKEGIQNIDIPFFLAKETKQQAGDYKAKYYKYLARNTKSQ
jgi:alpha-tubulin suppressor-like RCC1 family protein